MIPIAVLASGRGSNFEALQAAITQGKLHAKICALVSDQPGALSIQKAQAAGIPSVVVPSTDYKGESGRRAHEEKLLEALQPFSPRFLVMAGYMRIVTDPLIQAFRSERGYSRIVNIHPSLLPAFPGTDAYAQAFHHGAKVTGVTIHLVDSGLDSGPICAQEAFSVTDCNHVEEVEKRGLAIEHRLYPRTLEWVLPERFETEKTPSGRLHVRAR